MENLTILPPPPKKKKTTCGGISSDSFFLKEAFEKWTEQRHASMQIRP